VQSPDPENLGEPEPSDAATGGIWTSGERGELGAGTPAANTSPLEKRGDEVGPYKLISQLGEGGFGTVWLAERRHPYVQRVALKLIKLGMDSKAVIARFEQERQALAVMNHPGIAKVLDGGLTASGRPYFAMEYVKGESITAFCDAGKLSVRARLELFIQACEAIQHAHLKGIVHRDLKPSNIIAFAVQGEGPSLKVIDFGVAKAMSQTLTVHTVYTETGQMIGTPEYMSPEQADPRSSDIDTRSDIYSLGVLMYELISGALPFDPTTLRSKAYGEIQRIIREDEPPTPSARLSALQSKDREMSSRIEKARGAVMSDIVRELRSELEWIPLMAMRKEPQKRYQAAMLLAQDIRNYLDGNPISAAPESSTYRMRKFIRRHRVVVRAVVASFVALAIGFSAAPIYKWNEARLELNEMQRFEILEPDPDPTVVTDPDDRQRIKATGHPWKIRHVKTGMVMLLVPPGDFMMGSPLSESGRNSDERQHPCKISKAFYLSQNEVSQMEYESVMGKLPSFFKRADLPVESVSWTLCKEFFSKTSGALRFPSEAEWEYACRAGTTTAFSFGESITPVQVNYEDKQTVGCGSLAANAWGFHEMHGNVWEWCEDTYGEYRAQGDEAAIVNSDASYRVLRGGSCYSHSYFCRGSQRYFYSPDYALYFIGFRSARTP